MTDSPTNPATETLSPAKAPGRDTVPRAVSRPPTGWELLSNRTFRAAAWFFAFCIVALVTYIVAKIFWSAFPAMREYGFHFIVGTTWDPNKNEFGIRPAIWGTLYTSLLALLIGSIFGVAVAIFLSERMMSSAVFAVLRVLGVQFHPVWGKLPDAMERLLKNLIELLAAIPSVVYGLWGIFVLVPILRPLCDWCNHNMGWLPLFGTNLGAAGVLPAALVLAIMILPTISAISRDALVAVPPKLREAAYGLGATRWEAILGVTVPTAATGIFGSIVLAFGRALGETMALAMLVGNSNTLEWSLFSPANTLAALLANTFPNAQENERAVLWYAALVLLAITLIVNIAGTLVLQQTNREMRGAR